MHCDSIDVRSELFKLKKKDSPHEKLDQESVGREECGVVDNEPLSYDLSAV